MVLSNILAGSCNEKRKKIQLLELNGPKFVSRERKLFLFVVTIYESNRFSVTKSHGNTVEFSENDTESHDLILLKIEKDLLLGKKN